MANFLCGLPFIKSLDAPVKEMSAGWTVAGIVTFPNGRAGSPTLAGDNGRGGGVGPQRSHQVGEPNSRPKTLGQRFTTSAFEQPALPKNTEVAERVRLQLGAEFFNAFDHPQWNGVALGFNNSISGRVTSAQDPRITQIGIKLSF